MSELSLAAPQTIASARPMRLRPPVSRRGIAYGLLLAGVVVVFILELMIGPVRIPLADTLQALTGGHASRLSWDRILLFARLPRAANALLSGAALGTCGLLLQTLFRNPLADPYVLGTVQGARLGVAVLVVISGAAGETFSSKFGFMGDITMAMGAAVGSTALMLVLMFAARRVNGVTLLILGLMLGFLCLGLVSIVLHFTDETQADVFEYWNDGSFAGATGNQLLILAPLVAIGIGVAASLVKSLNALLLGEGYAATMGIAVGRVRMLAFASTALLAGVVTAYSGPVAFLGLVVAHLSRGLFRTSDHRILIPAAAIMGSLVALATDLITHLPWSKHFLHLNAVEGLVGAPVVIWVILRNRNNRTLEI
jgi:iron complex transport system permease protein